MITLTLEVTVGNHQEAATIHHLLADTTSKLSLTNPKAETRIDLWQELADNPVIETF